MGNKQQEAQAYFELAKIIATIAGFFFIASGVFFGISSQYSVSIMETEYKLLQDLKEDFISNITYNPEYQNTLNLYIEATTDLIRSSTEALNLGILLFYFGFGFIIFAIVIWLVGARYIFKLWPWNKS